MIWWVGQRWGGRAVHRVVFQVGALVRICNIMAVSLCKQGCFQRILPAEYFSRTHQKRVNSSFVPQLYLKRYWIEMVWIVINKISVGPAAVLISPFFGCRTILSKPANILKRLSNLFYFFPYLNPLRHWASTVSDKVVFFLLLFNWTYYFNWT